MATSLCSQRHTYTADSWDPESVVPQGANGISMDLFRAQVGGMEWSATGRMGVSLAGLSAVRDVSFSFSRAASRLAEMQRDGWNKL